MTVSEYRNLELGQRAWERWAEEHGQSWTGYGPMPDRPSEYEARMVVWYSAPNRYRVERAVVSGLTTEPYSRVLDGSDEWYYAPSTGVFKNPSGGAYIECDIMLDPRPLLSGLRFGEITSGERTGRAVVEAQGTLAHVERAPESLQELGLGADRYELAADAEHGVLVELRAVFESQEMFRLTATDVAFNDELDDALFRFDVPPDVQVIDADDIDPPEALSLEEAAKRASFTLLVPNRVPERADLHVSYQAPSAAPTMVERVYLMYAFSSAAHTLVIAQTDAADTPGEAAADWASERRDDCELRHRDHGTQREVEIERAGTRARISSDLELETLIELALSLEPAPTEPPGLLDA